MNCPTCNQPLEELLAAQDLKPCGIYCCRQCGFPDNRYIKQATKLVSGYVQFAESVDTSH